MFECPSCDYTGDSEFAVKIHHYQKHGERALQKKVRPVRLRDVITSSSIIQKKKKESSVKSALKRKTTTYLPSLSITFRLSVHIVVLKRR